MGHGFAKPGKVVGIGNTRAVTRCEDRARGAWVVETRVSDGCDGPPGRSE